MSYGPGSTSRSGIEIPDGRPASISLAASSFADLGSDLSEQAATIGSSSTAVTSADWYGPASLSYSLAASDIGQRFDDAATALADGSAALKAFAVDLQSAQDDAESAAKAGDDALDRKEKAEADLATARAAEDAARAAEGIARTAATTARALGPAGESAAQTADGIAAAAAGKAQDAATAAGQAQRRLDEAIDDLQRARRRGREANTDAERAGRTAAGAMDALASAAIAPELAIRPPVPITVQGASDPLTGLPEDVLNPMAGGGRVSPSDARRQQIARDQAARNGAAQDAADNKGTIGDGVSGLIRGWTLGAVDLGGDKDSDRYRGGDAASYIPITPGSIVRSGGGILGRRGAREGGEEVAEQTTRRNAPLTVPKDVHVPILTPPSRVGRSAPLNLPTKVRVDAKGNIIQPPKPPTTASQGVPAEVRRREADMMERSGMTGRTPRGEVPTYASRESKRLKAPAEVLRDIAKTLENLGGN